MQTIKINVQLTGVSPLLLNKYTTGSISGLNARINKGNDAKNYEGEWVNKLYTNKDGDAVIPSAMLRACIFTGCKGMRKGKLYFTRVIMPSIDISPWEPLLLFENKKITVDRIAENGWVNVCGAVVSGRRIDRQRPEILPGWTIDFTLTLSNDQITVEDIKNILNNAGQWAGLGDSRPSAPKKPLGYGRFQVTKFEVVK
jgi:hypothetical protein